MGGGGYSWHVLPWDFEAFAAAASAFVNKGFRARHIPETLVFLQLYLTPGNWEFCVLTPGLKSLIYWLSLIDMQSGGSQIYSEIL